MPALEQYAVDFLVPAHPLRWAKEPIRTIRRDTEGWVQWLDDEGVTHYRQFLRNAMDHELDDGTREVYNWRDELVAEYKIHHLPWNTWQKFRANVDRRLGQKVTKYWILATYEENTHVGIIRRSS